MRFALVLALAACNSESDGSGVTTVAPAPQPITATAGAPYKARLLAAIANADRIVLNEHSYKFDGVDMRDEGANTPQPKPVVTYAEVTMTSAQKARFASMIAAMPAAASGDLPFCIFEGRHSIQFHVKGKLDSTLDICFHCGQLAWNGNDQLVAPDAVVKTLKAVIQDAGLTPVRDWNRYAIEHQRRH